MSNTYSNIDRLSSKARGRLSSVSGGGILTAVVYLSGILSALFFWQNSTLVFRNVWPPAALLLGLLVGLMPAEGAFFGWKAIRGSKTDMTEEQLNATTAGLIAAVVSSVFSTLAMFVVSFEFVPVEIQQYSAWIVFIALSIPIVAQVIAFSYFAVNERRVTENFERAKLSALGFDAWKDAETARIQAIIDGMNTALDVQIQDYGKNVGEQEAAAMLQDGSQALLSVGSNGHQAAAPHSTATAAHPTPTDRTNGKPRRRPSSGGAIRTAPIRNNGGAPKEGNYYIVKEMGTNGKYLAGADSPLTWDEANAALDQAQAAGTRAAIWNVRDNSVVKRNKVGLTPPPRWAEGEGEDVTHALLMNGAIVVTGDYKAVMAAAKKQTAEMPQYTWTVQDRSGRTVWESTPSPLASNGRGG